MDSPSNARPYRSHAIPACDFCRRRKVRCDRAHLDEPCSLCRSRKRRCTAKEDLETPRQAAGAPEPVAPPLRPPHAASPAAVHPVHPSPVHPSPAVHSVHPVHPHASSPAPSVSGHIVGPTLARDAQVLEQYRTDRAGSGLGPGQADMTNVGAGAANAAAIAATAATVSHVHPNPYSIYSDDPRDPVVYMTVPRQRTRPASGNGTPGFRQCEAIDKVLEPLGPAVIDLYFEAVHPAFPLLDEAAIRAAYAQGALPHALTCELYAVALVFWPRSAALATAGRPVPDVRYIWNRTVSAMHDDFQAPCFSTVVACILDLLGRPITSITYNAVNVGRAVALAQSLGLNRDPARWRLERRQKALRVRTWWALYVHDVWASLSHGTPGHIHRDQWDVALPDEAALLDSEMPATPAHRAGAQTFVALCRLTQILGDILAVVYCLRLPPRPPEQVLRTLRRCETAVDDWEAALPAWLRRVAGDAADPMDAIDPDVDDAPGEQSQTPVRDRPGALNLVLAGLAVRMCLARAALQVARTASDSDNNNNNSSQDDDSPAAAEAAYRQSRCIQAGDALIAFVVTLTVPDTRAFWLPYAAYHFASAASLMLRCALEAAAAPVGCRCVQSARRLVDFLRQMQADAGWDLAAICLGQCEATVRQLSDGGYEAFRTRRERRRSVVVQTGEGGGSASAAGYNNSDWLADAAAADGLWDVEQQQPLDTVYFPALWQADRADDAPW